MVYRRIICYYIKMNNVEKFINEIKCGGNKELANHHQKFFKTGKGEYGEGDLFLGLTAPQMKEIVKKFYKELSLDEVSKLLQNPYHEIRSGALQVMVKKYQKGSEKEKSDIFNLYLANTSRINNWDLVDITAHHIVGHYVYHYSSKEVLRTLSKSNHLWSERISVIAPLYFIRQNDFDFTLEMCQYFLPHKHDLMHKATGWMLREVGKRDINFLYDFLDKNAQYMPRTMLRYAIERLPEEKRKSYLAVKKVN